MIIGKVDYVVGVNDPSLASMVKQHGSRKVQKWLDSGALGTADKEGKSVPVKEFKVPNKTEPENLLDPDLIFKKEIIKTDCTKLILQIFKRLKFTNNYNEIHIGDLLSQIEKFPLEERRPSYIFNDAKFDPSHLSLEDEFDRTCRLGNLGDMFDSSGKAHKTNVVDKPDYDSLIRSVFSSPVIKAGDSYFVISKTIQAIGVSKADDNLTVNLRVNGQDQDPITLTSESTLFLTGNNITISEVQREAIDDYARDHGKSPDDFLKVTVLRGDKSTFGTPEDAGHLKSFKKIYPYMDEYIPPDDSTLRPKKNLSFSDGDNFLLYEHFGFSHPKPEPSKVIPTDEVTAFGLDIYKDGGPIPDKL